MKVLLALVSLAVLFQGCFFYANDPVAVAEQAIQMVESRNPEKVAQYFTPTPGAIMKARLERQYALTDGCRVENVRGWLKSETEYDARVQIEWDMVWILGGVEDTEHQTLLLQLTKDRKNKWLINEAFGV